MTEMCSTPLGIAKGAFGPTSGIKHPAPGKERISTSLGASASAYRAGKGTVPSYHWEGSPSYPVAAQGTLLASHRKVAQVYCDLLKALKLPLPDFLMTLF